MSFDHNGVWRPQPEREALVSRAVPLSDPRRLRRLIWSARIFLALMAMILLGALVGQAFGQPMRYEHWQGPNGRQGEYRSQGTTQDWVEYGPKGQQQSCHSYMVGTQRYTSCR